MVTFSWKTWFNGRMLTITQFYKFLHYCYFYFKVTLEDTLLSTYNFDIILIFFPNLLQKNSFFVLKCLVPPHVKIKLKFVLFYLKRKTLIQMKRLITLQSVLFVVSDSVFVLKFRRVDRHVGVFFKSLKMMNI